MQEFTDLGLSLAVAKAFASLGFEAPTEIQKLAIPAILERRDAYLSSATGTGKTFAYLAPILSSLDVEARTLQAIIVTPTHDLAAQIERETIRLVEAAGLSVRVASALGSIPLRRQLDRLAEKPHILVGSAGRIRDLALAGHIDLSACTWAVLDEADRLFENEAIDITSELLTALPAGCCRLLVSASLPNRTVERSSAWFRDPARLMIDSSEALRTSIEHWCFHSASRSKLEFLRRFEASVKPERCLLFASSNAAIFTIQKRLEYLGFPAVVLKSDKDGTERRNALQEFSSGAARWLITTDLGARGLDLPDVSHVISFDLPEEPTVYMHRAGRTGRAGKHGVSVALADLVELKRASKIAVRYGFPFVCKLLDSGVVHDIEPENFFAIAEEEEAARKDVKLEGTKRPDPRRRPRIGGSPMERPREDRRPHREPGREQPRPPSREQNRPPVREPSRDQNRDRPQRSFRDPSGSDRPRHSPTARPQQSSEHINTTAGLQPSLPGLPVAQTLPAAPATISNAGNANAGNNASSGGASGGPLPQQKRRHRRRKTGPKDGGSKDSPKPASE
jgi:superfamily II DNA/RNA helicase